MCNREQDWSNSPRQGIKTILNCEKECPGNVVIRIEEAPCVVSLKGRTDEESN